MVEKWQGIWPLDCFPNSSESQLESPGSYVPKAARKESSGFQNSPGVEIVTNGSDEKHFEETKEREKKSEKKIGVIHFFVYG